MSESVGWGIGVQRGGGAGVGLIPCYESYAWAEFGRQRCEGSFALQWSQVVAVLLRFVTSQKTVEAFLTPDLSVDRGEAVL